jgi:ABC-type phosphate transport system substrate-binding protein
MGKIVFIAMLLLAAVASWGHAGVVVIGHDSLGSINPTVLKRIYTGRAVQVADAAVTPVNLKAGDRTRSFFFRAVLQRSDDEYIAYWIVRRAIGKGAPPLEVDTARDMIDYVRSTPGAIGYIDATQLEPGVQVLLSLP